MNNFVLMLLIAMFLLSAAWAVEDVPEVTENFDISDEDLFLDLGLAIGGITSGRIDPQAAGSCEGSLSVSRRAVAATSALEQREVTTISRAAVALWD
jgi:hypothetical protein